MCKIVIIPNMTKIKKQDLTKYVNAIADVLSSQPDGFGYAIQGVNGVFGERTTTPKEFASKVFAVDRLAPLKFTKKSYNKLGEYSKINGAGIFHGRISTNTKNIINTHPIQRDNWTLIHNGVVTNHGIEYAKLTSNDTEDLVYYMANGGIAEIERHITGYYAFGAFDPNGQLHVVRDNIASLNVAFSEVLESYVFATTKAILEKLDKVLKLDLGHIEEMDDNKYLIFDKGQLVSESNISPRGYQDREWQHASKSVGYLTEDKKPIGKKITSKKQKRERIPWNGHLYDATTSYPETPLDEPLYRLDGASDDSLEAYLDEVSNADASYTFYDMTGKQIDLDDFMSLDSESKLTCTVQRFDGTIVDPQDYYNRKLPNMA